MRKIRVIEISLILLINIVIVNLVAAETRINEVELNPFGADSGNEWIELYSEQMINLNGWVILNYDNENKTLNQNFQGYLIINLKGQWLDNENESVRLFDNNGLLVFQTPILKDAFNDNKTWSYCNGNWILISSTAGLANNCTTLPNISQNDSKNDSIKKNIILEMNWDENDIRNGENFDIEIKALNLENKEYDVKVYIYKDENKGKVISQSYDDENNNWISSDNYIKNFFKGPGNKTYNINLRIKDSYRDFEGDARIGFRIRETDSFSYKAEIEEDIDILKAKTRNDTETNADSENNKVSSQGESNEENKNEVSENTIYLKSGSSSKITGNAIQTGDTIKLGANKKIVVYESKNEKIMKYSIFAFVLLIIALIILFIIKGFK